MESPSVSDTQLVAATLSGSLSAFEALVVRHQGRLYLHALSYVHAKEEAQDVLQDAFLKAYNQLHELKDSSRFSAWVGQIVRNICLNKLRASRRLQATARSAAEQDEPRDYQEQPIFGNAALEELLSRLPQRCAEAFRLHYLEGYAIQDVALRVEATSSVVKQRLYRARRQLQEEVTRMAKDERSRYDLPEGFEAQTIARLLDQGRQSRLYMKMDDARARFREALEVSPDHPEALAELGCTYDPISGPSPEDVATLERASKAAPNSIEVALALTVMLARDSKRQSEAIENCVTLCRRRLVDHSDDTAALTAMAQVYLWKGDFQMMEEVARQAVSLAPEDQQCLNYLALSLVRQARWDEAYPLYETVYELDGKTFWAYVALRQMAAYLAFQRGDWKGAVKAQEKVWTLTSRPNEAGNLIYFYGQAGMVDEAKVLFTQVKDHPHPQRVYEVVDENKN